MGPEAGGVVAGALAPGYLIGLLLRVSLSKSFQHGIVLFVEGFKIRVLGTYRDNDEAINGLPNHLALFLPCSHGDTGQFVTLALCQIYLRSYHATL